MGKFKIGKMLWPACVLAALVAGCGREQAPSPPFPMVTATSPANGATGVLTNTIVTVGFSSVMNPVSINATSFTLTGPGATPVAGAVSYSGTTATFTPAASLSANTAYIATITTGAQDPGANPLAANFVWSFTTGAPTVISTVPASGATAVPVNTLASATFSGAMDPATMNAATFTVNGPGANPVTGTVTYAGSTATFTPSAALATSTLYTATITTGAKDPTGASLAANFVWTFTTAAPNPWSFTVGASVGPTAPNLGAASTFGAFGGGAGITNMGTSTVINGNIGTTGVSTSMTGFHDAGAGCTYIETASNAGFVNGTIDTAPPPPTGSCPSEGTPATLAIATQAASDAQAAYTDLAGRPAGPDPGAGQLGGLTLAPGTYTSAAASFMLTGSDLTLDGQGDANAIWVFQMASSLTVGAPGFPRSVILINGANAKNVFWQVGSAATLNGAGGGTMVGTIIAPAGVTFSTAGNAVITTLDGRALGLGASVTMVNTVINVPAP